MRHIRKLALGASLLALVSACATGGGSGAQGGGTTSPAGGAATAAQRPPIRIGSAGFYEARLMGEIYARALEANGYTVQRNLGLGTREVIQPALTSGQVDLLPEYIGSALGFYDKSKPTGDAAANHRALQEVMRPKGVTVLDYTPAQDQNGFVVRQDTAQQYNLRKVSDLAPIQDQLKWGLPPECSTNPLCGPALRDLYGIQPKNVVPLAACDAPIAQALQNRAVDVAELCTTQPDIVRFNFVLLEDDKKSQPAENIAPLVRDDYLAKVDAEAFKRILNGVSAKMTTEELTRLGVAVNVEQKDIGDVASGWLRDKGLIQ